MKNKSSIAYSLFCRFEGLIRSIKEIDTLSKYPVRYKPLFTSYNSCIETFRQEFPNEYETLNLESLPLKDQNNNHSFTGDKISTLLHQSESVLSLLKGISPYQFAIKPTSARESLAWFWHNIHYSLILYLAGLIIVSFIAGITFSNMSVYKNIIKPFINEYKSFSITQQKTITNDKPPRQNSNKK